MIVCRIYLSAPGRLQLLPCEVALLAFSATAGNDIGVVCRAQDKSGSLKKNLNLQKNLNNINNMRCHQRLGEILNCLAVRRTDETRRAR